ncbi:uncharacterized protein FOMMEDRAFT_23206 [Fomitiporia mediterranea MF3/22]|uniref:uncharacterized protein n=1 Tax=Fomitiporia mediterranea (strain MF3/22) TaxID=694068 RepID=UPI000440860A|nr:uncharacterized protein FOMMEDRAFT_23206 [Fomitiporia mediterranea MF3/22]EJC99334.1 hypothetical protein FOMMEDRAFT_23206 [Fomitiporia mediterranea MF3/22]
MEQHRLIPLGRVEEIAQETVNLSNALNNLSQEFAGIAHDGMADIDDIYEFKLYQAREQNKRAIHWGGDLDERPNLARLPCQGLQQLPGNVPFPHTADEFFNLTMAQYGALLQAYGQPDNGHRTDLMIRLLFYITGL